jgi:dihydrofolate synthase/folylpolyglutamate synthase
MLYTEALEYIYSFVDYERREITREATSDFDLERFAQLLDILGRPQDSFNIVHIVGTNGKGSTAAVLAGILSQAGLKVGLYTSPHLQHIRERIQVNSSCISREDFARGVEFIAQRNPRLTEKSGGYRTVFEILTALALLHFHSQNVEWAVVEAGLGGRLDATNVLYPKMVIITPIALDHTQVLGESLEEIAGEKSAVLKRGVLAVSAPQAPEVSRVITAQAREMGVELRWLSQDYAYCVGRTDLEGTDFTLEGKQYHTPLLGSHQAMNCSLSACAALYLQEKGLLSDMTSAISEGIAKTCWPGRLQVWTEEPRIIFDGAHNPSAAEQLARSFRDLFADRRAVLLLGVCRDKEVAGIAKALAPIAKLVIATQAEYPRALPAEELGAIAARFNSSVLVEENPMNALQRARNLSENGVPILVTGSFYLVGDLQRKLAEEE